jgi:hypothetical protein
VQSVGRDKDQRISAGLSVEALQVHGAAQKQKRRDDVATANR